jgi:hypothetical protein
LLRLGKIKKLQDWQAYSHLYWEIKLKQIVEDEWVKHKQTALETAVAENAAPPTLPDHHTLPFRNDVVRREFKEESPEVKTAVEEY